MFVTEEIWLCVQRWLPSSFAFLYIYSAAWSIYIHLQYAVKYHIQFKLAVFMHQVITQRCPSYFADLAVFSTSDTQRRSLWSASTCAAVTRRTRTELGRRAFTVCDPDVWNNSVTIWNDALFSYWQKSSQNAFLRPFGGGHQKFAGSLPRLPFILSTSIN